MFKRTIRKHRRSDSCFGFNYADLFPGVGFLLTPFYLSVWQLIEEHKEVLDKAKCEYEQLKKVVDELRASEVLLRTF